MLGSKVPKFAISASRTVHFPCIRLTMRCSLEHELNSTSPRISVDISVFIALVHAIIIPFWMVMDYMDASRWIFGRKLSFGLFIFVMQNTTVNRMLPIKIQQYNESKSARIPTPAKQAAQRIQKSNSEATPKRHLFTNFALITI